MSQFTPDPSALKREAAERVRQQSQSFLDERRLAEVLDAVPDGVVVLNACRQIVFANRALLEKLGADGMEKVLGKRPGEVLDCEHAADGTGGCGTTVFCSTCGAAKAIVASLQGRRDVQECRIIQRSGGALDLRVWTTPTRQGDERFTIFAVADIGDEKRRGILERIFFHDVMNTAGGVKGYAEMIEESPAEERQQLAQIVRRLASRLVDEIGAQRELLAAEQRELAVRPQPLRSLAVLSSLRELFGSHESAQDRQLAIDPAAADVEFSSDRVLLSRILGNLVKNALEAAPPGGTATLACGPGVNGDAVEFRVHNPGCMARQTQLQVFQRSYSTKGAGRGLGTYSARLLTEQYLGGRISFTTSPQAGTTFTVALPAAPPAAE